MSKVKVNFIFFLKYQLKGKSMNQRAMLGFQLLYIFEGNPLNNNNRMGQIQNVGHFFIINKKCNFFHNVFEKL